MPIGEAAALSAYQYPVGHVGLLHNILHFVHTLKRSPLSLRTLPPSLPPSLSLSLIDQKDN